MKKRQTRAKTTPRNIGQNICKCLGSMMKNPLLKKICKVLMWIIEIALSVALELLFLRVMNDWFV